MGDGVAVADENGKFLFFNPAAEQIMGLGATEAPPDGWTKRYGVYLPDTITPYSPEDLPLARAMRGEAVDGAELFVRNPNTPGGVWVNVTGRPLKHEDGTVRGGVVVRSEEHTSELQSLAYLVCRLLLEKKKNNIQINQI